MAWGTSYPIVHIQGCKLYFNSKLHRSETHCLIFIKTNRWRYIDYSPCFILARYTRGILFEAGERVGLLPGWHTGNPQPDVSVIWDSSDIYVSVGNHPSGWNMTSRCFMVWAHNWAPLHTSSLLCASSIFFYEPRGQPSLAIHISKGYL